MIRVLHDTKEGYPFMADLLPELTVRHFSPARRKKYLIWLGGSLQVMRRSKKDDIIVCLYDFQAILCYWIGLLTGRRRKILAINILLKQKNTLRNRLATWLYRKALKSPDFIATVTTEEYGHQIADRFRINREFPVLKDVFYSSYLTDAIKAESDGSVFCGGRNGRDWDFIFKVADKLPGVRFNVVAPEEIAARHTDLPANVALLSNLSYSDFFDLMAKASVVALPLDTEAPAGLIVIFQAAALGIPVVITDTVSTRAYITPQRGYALEADTRLWADTIEKIIRNPDSGCQKTERLLEYLSTECSEKAYVQRIEEILNPWLSVQHKI